MSRKRGKKPKPAVEAVPDDILAEGSGPVRQPAVAAIETVEDVVTTDDIATTDDVVTADDVVATPAASSSQDAPGPVLHADDPDGLLVPEAETASEEDDADSEAAMLAMTGDAASESVDGGDGDGDGASLDGDGDSSAGTDGEPGEPGADDEDGGIVFPTSAASMDAVQLKHLVEALIFASDRPLTVQRLRQLTRVGDVRRLEQALTEIAEDYRERGLVLQQVSGGYQFRTRTQFSAWVQQLIAGRPVRLSRAQLETLAIIAYRQPITRPEIDDIRGVDSSATLKLLIDRMLIRVLGKREEVGRPMLYGTTKEFLDFFSLGDLRELPTLREYSELTAESRKVMSDRLGVPVDGVPGGDNGGDGDGGAGGGGDDGSGGAGGSGDDGGSDGGASGGGGPVGSGGGDLGGGGSLSDDGATMSAATADDLADAVASYLSAADAVERSEAAVIEELVEPDPELDALEAVLGEDDAETGAAEADAVEADAVEAGAVEAGAVETGAVEAGAVEAGAVEAGAVEAGAVEAGAVEAGAVEAGAVEAGAVAAGEFADGSDEVDVRDIDVLGAVAVADVVREDTDGPAWDGQVSGESGWPAGSQGVEVASTDDGAVSANGAAVEAIGPRREPPAIDTAAVDDSLAEPGTTAAAHAEPAVE